MRKRIEKQRSITPSFLRLPERGYTGTGRFQRRIRMSNVDEFVLKLVSFSGNLVIFLANSSCEFVQKAKFGGLGEQRMCGTETKKTKKS